MSTAERRGALPRWRGRGEQGKSRWSQHLVGCALMRERRSPPVERRKKWVFTMHLSVAHHGLASEATLHESLADPANRGNHETSFRGIAISPF
jgi:hypothetical protein